MNPAPPNPQPDDPPCNTIVFRVLRVKQWIDPDDDRRVKSEAFMRRKPRTLDNGHLDPGDDDGLSVFDSFHMNIQACRADEGSRSGHGIASLHVGTLRSLGLEVIRDPQDQRKVLITNMPFENPNEAAQEALLDRVADSARIASSERWKRPKATN
jgi:hypothetical protein